MRERGRRRSAIAGRASSGPLSIIGLMLLCLFAVPARAQAPSPVQQRANLLIEFWNGDAQAGTVFAPAFLAAVPAERVAAIALQVRTDLGKATGIAQIKAASSTSAEITFAFERGQLDVRLAVESQPPHLVQGLLVTGSRREDDSLAKIVAELNALPGFASLNVARLGTGAPTILAGTGQQRASAIGSVFKLFVLAEIDRQVSKGERRWTDVVPLTHKSLPSGSLQDWPAQAPLTLYSLAALMISQSDNSATDTLLHLVGRERVEAGLPRLGIVNAAANRPFLTTFEAFALKGGDQALTRRWLAGDEKTRRSLLRDLAAVRPEQIDAGKLQGRPAQIDEIEWFASTDNLVRTLDWLRRNGGKETLEILAINPGLQPTLAQRLAYWGYKGGSETGVIAMSFLVRNKAGTWYAVAATWNEPAAPVEDAKFVALLSRAMSLIPQ
jgi:beta-lactamase class A